MTKRIISILLIALILVFTLTSCGLSREKVVGEWIGEWEYKGVDIIAIIDFSSNGTYTELKYKDSVLSDITTDTYTIEGRKVILKDGISTMTLKYSNGRMKNGGHYYYPAD